jgi:hypothetical protein
MMIRGQCLSVGVEMVGCPYLYASRGWRLCVCAYGEGQRTYLYSDDYLEATSTPPVQNLLRTVVFRFGNQGEL